MKVSQFAPNLYADVIQPISEALSSQIEKAGQSIEASNIDLLCRSPNAGCQEPAHETDSASNIEKKDTKSKADFQEIAQRPSSPASVASNSILSEASRRSVQPTIKHPNEDRLKDLKEDSIQCKRVAGANILKSSKIKLNIDDYLNDTYRVIMLELMANPKIKKLHIARRRSDEVTVRGRRSREELVTLFQLLPTLPNLKFVQLTGFEMDDLKDLHTVLQSNSTTLNFRLKVD